MRYKYDTIDFGLSIIVSWIANKIDETLNKLDKINVSITPRNISSPNINSSIIEKETESMLLTKWFQKLIDLMNENRSKYAEVQEIRYNLIILFNTL